MKNLQTLKLNASSIGSAAPRQNAPTPSDETTQELKAPAAPALRAPRRPATALRKHMLVLLVVEAAATLAAVAATGDVHNTLFRIASAAIALTVALVVAVETAASLRRKSTAAAAAPAARRPAAPMRSLTKSKIALLLVMAIGFATYFGGGGSFSSFSAEDTNPNSNVASGTLTMSDVVNNSTTACFSFNGLSANNVNQSCDAAFSLTGTGTPNSAPAAPANPTGAGNVGPGAFGGVAKLVLENTGSLDAGTFKLVAPYVSATLHTTAIPIGTFTTIKINNLEGPITSGDTLLISYGSQSLSVCASGAYAPVSPITTDITVNVTACPSGTATNGTGATIPVGATVVDTSSDTASTNTDCYDQKATTNQVAGATVGSSLTFNTGVTTNSLCNTALLYVQEVGTGHNYCWFGVIDGASNAAANGMCAAPISTSPTSLGSGTIGTGSYTVPALQGNVKNGDSIVFTQGNNVETCVATADAQMTTTSISVNSCVVTAGTNGSYTTAVVITDSSTLTLLNPGPPSLAADTIGSFDTSKSGTNGINLYPVSSNGVAAVGAPVSLPKYDSSGHTSARTFYVGVFLPNANGSNQNTIQGLMSTFGLTWHLGQ